MKIEGTLSELDQFMLGIQMAYGEDERGSFHMIELGFLFFSITIYKYY